jgi:hypothetical protein
MRSVLSSAVFHAESWCSLRASALSESMSLYRARLRLARFVPLGITMPPSLMAPSGFADVSSVFRPALTSRRDPRSNPRPQALDIRIYVRSSLIVSRAALPEEQGRRNASGR